MNFLSEYLRRNVTEYPERIAVIEDERAISYRELNEQSNRFANALCASGSNRGCRVAVLMHNSITSLIVFYACQKLGIGIVMLHARLLSDEILRTVELTETDTLVYAPEFKEKADFIAQNSSVCRRCIPSGLPGTPGSFEDILCCAESSEVQQTLDGSEDSLVFFTSGTTSKAKGIVRTQNMMASYAALFADELSLSQNDTMLTPAPLYHAAGLCCAIKMLVNAGTLVLLGKFDCEKVCRQIQKHRVSQITLIPPSSYQRLAASGYPEQYDLSSIQLTHLAAGKASHECIRTIFELFPDTKLRLSWGSTETSNVTCSILTQEQLRDEPKLLDTIGKLNPISRLKLIDRSGAVVEGSGEGEAYVNSPLVFSGYIKAKELTAASFSDGWFITGDILRRDADGYYYLLSRTRDIIKTGGENVYAQEVEQVILSHPSVEECAVVGVPDFKFGEAVAVALVMKPGMSIKPDEFISFCKQKLPSYKKPKYWAVVDALPKNDIGKVKKTVLEAQAEQLFQKIL